MDRQLKCLGQTKLMQLLTLCMALQIDQEHLADTFPIKPEDNPPFVDFGGRNDHSNYREVIFAGYRYYDIRHDF